MIMKDALQVCCICLQHEMRVVLLLSLSEGQLMHADLCLCIVITIKKRGYYTHVAYIDAL